MMVNRAVCEDCETQVDYLVRDGPIYCECGEEMEFYGKVGCVTGVGNDIRPEAMELVEEWREDSDLRSHPGVDTRTLGYCADELEQLIESTREVPQDGRSQ